MSNFALRRLAMPVYLNFFSAVGGVLVAALGIAEPCSEVLLECK